MITTCVVAFVLVAIGIFCGGVSLLFGVIFEARMRWLIHKEDHY